MRELHTRDMPGSANYRGYGREEQESVTDNLYHAVQSVGESASDIASEAAAAVRERPYTTMAIAGGLAFAIGAIWMLRRQQHQSRLDTLLSHLPEMPKREDLMRRWR